MGPYGFLLFLIGPYRCLQVLMGPYDSLRFLIASLDCNFIFDHSASFGWFHSTKCNTMDKTAKK